MVKVVGNGEREVICAAKDNRVGARREEDEREERTPSSARSYTHATSLSHVRGYKCPARGTLRAQRVHIPTQAKRRVG